MANPSWIGAELRTASAGLLRRFVRLAAGPEAWVYKIRLGKLLQGDFIWLRTMKLLGLESHPGLEYPGLGYMPTGVLRPLSPQGTPPGEEGLES
jgi:hypothetical protein